MAGSKIKQTEREDSCIAGNRIGGLKAAQVNRERYGKDFYAKIGSEGGKNGTTGGFWYAKYVKGDNEFARIAGAKGGKLSKKGKNNER